MIPTSAMQTHHPAPISPATRKGLRYPWRQSVVLMAGYALLMSVAALFLDSKFGHLPVIHGYSVFWLFFGWDEPIPLIVLAALSLLCLRPPVGFFKLMARAARRLTPLLDLKQLPWIAAAVVFLASAIGTFSVCLNHPLSMDEYTMDYQAQIFASGHQAQVVTKQWMPESELLRPMYAAFNDDDNTWYPVYLPVYSLIRAGFTVLHVPFLLNPLLTALGIPLLAGILRHLWPEDRWLHGVGTLLLATCAQFVVTGMTVFPLTMHLFFNLLWLYCYTKKDSRLWWWCPWIGVVALGIHQPVPHALFVIPFLFHVLCTRRWWQTAYFAVIYLAGCYGWYKWLDAWCAQRAQDNPFQWFNIDSTLNLLADSALVLSWVGIFILILAAYAIIRRKLDSTMAVLSLVSVVLTMTVYGFFPENQGHGWGYRYIFQELGCLIIIACAGLRTLRSDFGHRRAQALVFVSLLASVGLLLVRCGQVRANTLPYAEVSQYLASLPTDVVIIDNMSIPYAVDFVRNKPDLSNRPLLIASPVSEAAGKDLISRFKVRAVIYKDLERFGY
ncbi:MAG: hypothetical protein QM796_22955 [Chthoniobacteraceae bacterium]